MRCLQAEEEGLPLLRGSGVSGYKCVHEAKNIGRHTGVLHWSAACKVGGALKILGYFPSAEEAALCYSRYLGRGLACEMADLAGQEDQPPPTVEEIWAAAAAEGYDLDDFRSERNQHGFLGVHRHATLTLRPYQARPHNTRACVACTVRARHCIAYSYVGVRTQCAAPHEVHGKYAAPHCQSSSKPCASPQRVHDQ